MKIFRIFQDWLAATAATAIAEFAIIFPILMTMLLGVWEMGNALSVNQKTITASQTIADLVARYVSVDDNLLDELVRAGELVIMPFGLEDMGVDIVSVTYNEGDTPEILWRETRNMAPHPGVLADVAGLGEEGDGVIVVTVSYNYHPFFGRILAEDVYMSETSFSRGRRTGVVERE